MTLTQFNIKVSIFSFSIYMKNLISRLYIMQIICPFQYFSFYISQGFSCTKVSNFTQIYRSFSFPVSVLEVMLLQHPELSEMPVLCGSLDGRGVWGRMDTCINICMAECLHCSPETITTLLVNYTPIQIKSSKLIFKKWRIQRNSHSSILAIKVDDSVFNWFRN